MQSLFRLEDVSNTGSVELRQWRFAREGLLASVEKIEQFYQDYPIAVTASHILARLIIAVNISRNLPFDRYVANCSARSLNVAQALKITTGLSKGQMWEGEFYGPGTNEILIGHDTYFPLQDAWDNWKSLQPVTVLTHSLSNTQLNIPDGRKNSLDKGLAVIAINIPMLMAQYYRFNQEQDEAELNGKPRRTMYQFLHSYALTGMVRSHLDNVWLNRLFNTLTGVPNTEAIRKHSFALVDYDNALDTCADQQVDFLRKFQKRFGGMMNATHMPVSHNLWSFSQLPSVPLTLQALWAMVASRIKVMAFLCVAQKNSADINSRELGTIRWMMKTYQVRSVMKANMGMEAYFQIAPYLDMVGID